MSGKDETPNSKERIFSGDSVPRPLGFIALMPIPVASVSPLGLRVSSEPQPGLRPGIGARVASQQSPILRSGRS